MPDTKGPQDEAATKKQMKNLNDRFLKFIETVQNLEKNLKNSEELSPTSNTKAQEEVKKLQREVEKLKSKNDSLQKRLAEEKEKRKEAENDRDTHKEKAEDATVEAEFLERKIELLNEEIRILKRKTSRPQNITETDGLKLVAELKDIRSQYDAVVNDLYKEKMDGIDQVLSEMKKMMENRFDEYKSQAGKDLDLEEEINTYSTLMNKGESCIPKAERNPGPTEPPKTPPKTQV